MKIKTNKNIKYLVIVGVGLFFIFTILAKNIIFKLTLITGILIYAVFYFTKRNNVIKRKNQDITILSSINLSKDLKLVSIRYGSKKLLIGVNNSNVSLVSDFIDISKKKEKNKSNLRIKKSKPKDRKQKVILKSSKADTSIISKINPRILGTAIFLIIILFSSNISASELNIGDFSSSSSFIKIFLAITVLSVAPAIILMMTPFTRVVISLSLLKHAIGLPTVPSNQIIAGLSLFITFFIMRPQIDEISTKAIAPYFNGKISYKEAIERTTPVLREFMYSNVRKNDLQSFITMAKIENSSEIPFSILIPAYITSELKTAFQIGVILFIPFILIDLLVASVLTSMGMIMIPPTMISMPIKLLIFVLVDGWNLVIGGLYRSFL